ncbi:MAG: hypothetical protein AAF206_07260 [Bacteroidota bacterium]
MDELIHLVDRFRAGELSPEERTAFEERLATDSKFAEEVRTYIQSRNLIQDMARQQIRKQVAQSYAAYQNQADTDTESKTAPEGKVRRMPRLVWLSAAAAVILLLIWVGTRESNSTPALSMQQMYAEAYQAPDLNFAARDEGDSLRLVDSLLQLTAGWYQQSQFDSILSLYKRYENQAELQQNGDWLYASGMSLLQLGRLDEAIARLENVRGRQKANAEWYTALIYLKKDDAKGAQQAFRFILEGPGQARQNPQREKTARKYLDILGGMTS